LDVDYGFGTFQALFQTLVVALQLGMFSQ